jgi:pyridoxine kinase
MTEIIVISSYVAASSVGGSIAPATLAHMGIDCCLAPTTLLGRHPGLGSPGGSAVPADRLASLLEGVEAHRDFNTCRGVVAGYFASPEQVHVAAKTIDAVKASTRPPEKPWLPPTHATIIVDPIMGDAHSGLYIREDTAKEIKSTLIQRADLITPNLWEFAYLTKNELDKLKTPDDIIKAAEALPCDAMITSVPSDLGIGTLYIDRKHPAVWFAETPKSHGLVPHGTGDLITILVSAGLCENRSVEEALKRAVGSTASIIDRALTAQLQDLPIAASGDLVRTPPDIKLTRLR